MLKRAVVFVMLLTVCASQEESQAETTTVVMLEKDPEGQFNFTEFDYCSLKCKVKGEEHSACDCKMRGQRTLVLDDLVQFRQDVLDKHNELRNLFASGQETNKHLNRKTASNMMVLNYDLELEHIAKCYGGYFVTGHDKCRMTHDEIIVGQNLAGYNAKELNYHMIGIEKWYNEVRFINSPRYFFGAFDRKSPPTGKITHFTLFVWWSISRVGCARIWNPGNKILHNKYVIICNYRAAAGLAPGNMVKGHIFDVGPPCTKCPLNTTCNVKYNSLCGKHYPAPSDPIDPLSTGKGSERLIPSQIISLCALVASMYFC